MGLLVAPPPAVAPPTFIWSRGGGTRRFPPGGPGNSLRSESGDLSTPASSASEPAGSSESESSRRIQAPRSGSSSSSRSALPVGWLRGAVPGCSGDLLTPGLGRRSEERAGPGGPGRM